VSELIEIFATIGGVFVGSCVLGYAATKIKRRRKPPVPQVNAVLRILTSGTVYRAHFVGVQPEGWAFTPPLQRDNYVPLRPGEPLVIETVMNGGVMIFRTTLKARHNSPPLLIADKPTSWHLDDRRESIRIGEVGHVQTKLDGDRVGLVDVSACGARVRSQARKAPGERVKLEITGMAEAIYAWVLDVSRKGDRYMIRLRFEETADLTALTA